MKRFARFVFQLIIILFLVWLFLLWGCSVKSGKGYNVIFISLDTTRYDYVDTGWGARAHTPELKRFSEKSIVFENAFSSSTQTLPSHLSVFTSRYPHELKVFSNEFKYDGRYKMIQQVFEEIGYRTAAIISLGTLGSGTGINRGFQEFRENLSADGHFFVPAEKVTSEAIEAAQRMKNEKFFLFVHYSDPHSPYAPPGIEGTFEIYLDGNLITKFDSYKGAILKKNIPLSVGNHTLEFRVKHSMEDLCHFVIRKMSINEGCTYFVKNLEYSKELYGGSYVMRSQFGQVFMSCDKESCIKIFQIIPILKADAAKRLYRMEVEYMDNFLGKFLGYIDQNSLENNTIIIIFGDHGEGHGEREKFFGHTKLLNRQFIQVPLMIRFPGYEGKRFNYPVSLVSISPTILEFLGIHEKSFNYKESVLRDIQKGSSKEKLIYSFAFDPFFNSNKLSIIKWPYQSIFYWERGALRRQEYYNLDISQSFSDEDAIDEDTIKKTSKEYYETFQRKYNQLKYICSLVNGYKKNKDKQDLERLKALGYIHD